MERQHQFKGYVFYRAFSSRAICSSSCFKYAGLSLVVACKLFNWDSTSSATSGCQLNVKIADGMRPKSSNVFWPDCSLSMRPFPASNITNGRGYSKASVTNSTMVQNFSQTENVPCNYNSNHYMPYESTYGKMIKL